MSFTRKDLLSALITGLTTGVIAWRVFAFLGRPDLMGISLAWLIIVVPLFWIAGVNLGYFLGRFFPFFNQFGKYAAIGFTNAAVDFGVLNFLIAWSGVAFGLTYTLFKTVSFIVAVTHSYLWNRRWAFEAHSDSGGREFVKFMVVNIVAAVINVGVASLVVNGVDPMFSLDQNSWANIGAVAGSAVALIFNFVGFKLVVFKKS